MKRVCAIGFALLPLACSAVLGIHDIQPPGDGGVADSGAEPRPQDAQDAQPMVDVGGESVIDASEERCTADAASDPLNCCACGHSCLGGVCSGGACTPSPLIAQIVGQPVAIVVDTTSLFVAAENYVDYCPLAGCGLTASLLTARGSTGTTITSLIEQSAALYLTVVTTTDAGSDGELDGKPISQTGTMPSEISESQLPPGAAVACGTEICWVSSGPSQGAVLACAPTGCAQPPTPLFKGAFALVPAIAWDGADVYFTDGTNIYSVDVSNPQPPATVIQRQGVIALAFRAGRLFWLESAGGGSGGEVMQCTLSSCVPTVVTLAGPGITALGQLAVDDQAVYWTVDRDPGEVDSCTIDGCGGKPRVLATQQTSPDALAVDSAKVYWAAQAAGGTYDIMWVAK